MAHHHLAFKLLNGFESNADKNYDRRTAYRNIGRIFDSRGDLRVENGEQCDNAYHERAEKHYL